MKLGVVPYADLTYEEVAARNHGYVEFIVEEGRRRGNLKTRFIQRAMQRAIATLFGYTGNVAIVGDPMTPEQSKEMDLGTKEEERLRAKVRRSRKK